MKERKIKFTVNAARWFDKINGNTYHSVKITRMRDGKVLTSHPICYGYGNHYEQTAFGLLRENKWLPVKYRDKSNGHSYEMENNYPIIWNVTDGLKRDMTNNVT